MRHPSTMALLLRTVLVLVAACGLVVCGVIADMVSGSSPLGVLISLGVAVTLGVIMVCIITASSFPGAGRKTGGGKPGA